MRALPCVRICEARLARRGGAGPSAHFAARRGARVSGRAHPHTRVLAKHMVFLEHFVSTFHHTCVRGFLRGSSSRSEAEGKSPPLRLLPRRQAAGACYAFSRESPLGGISASPHLSHAAKKEALGNLRPKAVRPGPTSRQWGTLEKGAEEGANGREAAAQPFSRWTDHLMRPRPSRLRR